MEKKKTVYKHEFIRVHRRNNKYEKPPEGTKTKGTALVPSLIPCVSLPPPGRSIVIVLEEASERKASVRLTNCGEKQKAQIHTPKHTNTHKHAHKQKWLWSDDHRCVAGILSAILAVSWVVLSTMWASSTITLHHCSAGSGDGTTRYLQIGERECGQGGFMSSITRI